MFQLKPLSFGLAMVAAVGLTACNKPAEQAAADPAAAPATGSSTQGTLEKIKQSGTIVLAHRDSSIPFSYIADNPNQPVGYAHDLQLKVVEAVKEKL